jgi:hypothetical protein
MFPQSSMPEPDTMKTRLLILAALLASALLALGQPIPATTPFARNLLLSTNAAHARDKIGVTNYTGSIDGSNITRNQQQTQTQQKL